MKTWFTSDLHLGHEAVIRFCNRPFHNADEMDEVLYRNWNRVVSDFDVVYCLGDMSFHRPQRGIEILSSLKGRKILVQGNHDKYSSAQYERAGFQAVVQECVLKLSGIELCLSHYPYKPNFLERYFKWQDKRYLNRRPHNDGKWLLCGHVHSAWKTKRRMINVGVDQWNYRPVPFGEIESIIRSQK